MAAISEYSLHSLVKSHGLFTFISFLRWLIDGVRKLLTVILSCTVLPSVLASWQSLECDFDNYYHTEVYCTIEMYIFAAISIP